MKMPEKIETDRLILVPMAQCYAEDVFREFTPEITVLMTVPVPMSINDSKQWIKTTISKYKDGTDYIFAILLRETAEFIGGGGIHHMDTKTPEFGIWTKKSSHGNKYGREAIQGAKAWADENLNYDYLKYPVFADNIASCKIPESLGGRVIRDYMEKNGAGVEMKTVEYRIDR